MAGAHRIAPCVDVGTLCKKFVDHAEVAFRRRQAEGGPTILRCGKRRGGGEGEWGQESTEPIVGPHSRSHVN